ncbi:SGNH/GDSL hydrolase family protein [Caldimonas brevitalea]|uniref:SGNH/GDSL hydrolase family protein n=1 Tax=Caldimonas brevitalea TaxID=413882 RepID=UPI0012FA12B5|nr:hypothetical protein [Caldimonas brevitalea]
MLDTDAAGTLLRTATIDDSQTVEVGGYPKRVQVHIDCTAGSLDYSTALSALPVAQWGSGETLKTIPPRSVSRPSAVRNSVVLLGSSSMAFTNDIVYTGAARYNHSAAGPLTWLAALSKRKFTLLKNLAQGGLDTDGVYARLGQALALRPEIVMYHAGTNGVFQLGRTADLVWSYAKKTLDALREAGIRVVLLVPQKWNTADAAYSTAKRDEYFLYCAYLRQYAAVNRDVILVNIPQIVQDGADANGNQLSNYFIDTKHLSNLAAYYVGKAIYEAVDPLFPEPGLVEGEEINYLTDAAMTTTVAAGTPFSGTLWSKFTLSRTQTPGVVASMVPAPDGSGMAQRLQITANANNDRVNVQIPSANILPLVAPGERITFEMNVRINSSTALRAFPQYFSRTNLAVTDMGRDIDTPTNDKAMPNEVIDVVLQTPAWDVWAGTTALDGFIAFLFNGAGSADVTLWNPRIRKVPSMPLIY